MLAQEHKTILQSTVIERAVLYARVSGDDRKYSTSGIEGQLNDCKKYAQDKNYTVVGEYFEEPDKKTSGYDMLPGLEKVLKLAEQKAFDVLIVREIDRLARNRFKQMSVENRLEQLDIRVEYVVGQFEDSTEGRLLKGLMSEFAQYERDKIRERVTRGIINATKKGNVITGGCVAPFGYDRAKVNGVNTLVINETEAAIVELIFDLYVDKRYSLHGIADYLDSHHIPKPAKGNIHKSRIDKKNVKGWSAAEISNILKNETYIGKWHYGKTKSVKDKLTGKRKQVKRDKSEWLMVEVPPIINDDIFKAAQERKEENKRQRGKQRKFQYLFGGMCKCGHCDNSMSGMTICNSSNKYQYYKCNAASYPKRYGYKCENNKGYKVKVVEAVVWGWLLSILENEEKLDKALKEYQEKHATANQPVINIIEANKAKIEKLQAEKERLITGYAQGILSLDDIAQQKTELEKRIADLTKAIELYQAELGPGSLTQDEIDFIKNWGKDIRDGLTENFEHTFEVKREIVTLLKVEVILSKDDKGLWADVSCVLGSEYLSASYNLHKRV